MSRLNAAEVMARARGCLPVLNNFGAVVLNSNAVIARTLGIVEGLVKSENLLQVSFHKQVRSGARLPEQNQWDQGRVAAESTILPHFYEEIIFAALSLDGRGVAAYGPYFIILKEPMIAHRATVFEENCVMFCRRHMIVAGDPPPVGYRAVWSERDKLAKAKLQAQLGPGTVPSDYPRVLVNQGVDTGSAEFIEVHIYGPIHRQSIQRVIGPRPRKGPDSVIWKSLDRELTAIGATLEAV